MLTFEVMDVWAMLIALEPILHPEKFISLQKMSTRGEDDNNQHVKYLKSHELFDEVFSSLMKLQCVHYGK